VIFTGDDTKFDAELVLRSSLCTEA